MATVTIGMPIHNNGATLQRAIDSVMAQGFGDWLLWISDDGSEDDGPAIARDAAARDPRIRFIRNDPRLGVGNFAVALSRAESPFFVWLAGDDWWAPDFLEATLRGLQAAPGAVSIMPQAAFAGPRPRPVPNLEFLKGDGAGRIARFLAHPGGSRIYGLMRTGPLRRAFPKGPLHAFDWYIMVALLREGPQLSLPRTLLYREETPWPAYADARRAGLPGAEPGRFPILRLSLMLLRDRKLPLGAVPALWRLNMRKNAEYLAVNRPDVFARRHRVRAALGLRGLLTETDRAGIHEWLSARQTPEAPRPSLPAKVGRQADAVALIAFRNAADTLGACIDHYLAEGCRVVVMDNGSTDDSRAVVEARCTSDRLARHDLPYHGCFDLTAQLLAKTQIIGTLPDLWVIHADADEFVHPPEGTTLRQALEAARTAGKTVLSTPEEMFLPRHEDERHHRNDFRTTMTWRTRFRERDQKQRVFRSRVPLDLWMRTGGHTVTRDIAQVAEGALILRHYPGLSLDDLRANYVSRVFSRRDLLKTWHGTRRGADALTIAAPPEGALAPVGEPAPVWSSHMPPVFRPLPDKPAFVPTAAVDLIVLDGHGDPEGAIRQAIDKACPGLRLHVTRDVADLSGYRNVPCLHVIRDPEEHRPPGGDPAEGRAAAEAWVRRIAHARQGAILGRRPHAELRRDDIRQGSGNLVDVLGCILGPGTPAGPLFLSDPTTDRAARDIGDDPFGTITTVLARELGYGSRVPSPETGCVRPGTPPAEIGQSDRAAP